MLQRLVLFLIITAIAGCSVPESLRVKKNDSSAILGVMVKVKLLNAFPKKQTTVYFVKLGEKDDGYLGTKIIPCNYTRDSLAGTYAYLINAEPGKYAVVCSTKYEKVSGTMVETKHLSEIGFITFFDENTIKQSIVEVGPGQAVYMGSFVINSQLKNIDWNIEKNGDNAQKHYYKLLKSYMDGTFYCGSLISADRSEKVVREFLTKNTGYFKNSDWKENIDKAIADLDKPREEKPREKDPVEKK